GNEAEELPAGRPGVEPERGFLADDRHLHVHGRAPALLGLLRGAIPAGLLFEDRAQVFDVAGRRRRAAGNEPQPAEARQQQARVAESNPLFGGRDSRVSSRHARMITQPPARLRTGAAHALARSLARARSPGRERASRTARPRAITQWSYRGPTAGNERMGTVQQGGSGEQPASPDDRLAAATVDCALVPLFRGRFCDVLLPDRAAVLFDEDDVIYELGDDDRVLFFIRDGLVKTGTITSQGREIIYDIRKSGDVVGELCALESVRRDRAVALARTEAVAVRFDEVVDVLAGRPALLREFTQVLCNALSEAYAQVNSLADDDVMQRL